MKSLVENIKEEKNACFDSISALQKLLNQIKSDKTHIDDQVQVLLKTAIETFGSVMANKSDLDQANEDVKKIKELFNSFAFTDTETFLNELEKAEIGHSHNKDSVSLNTLRQQVIAYLEGRLESNLENKVDELTGQAEQELSTAFVQNILNFNGMHSGTLDNTSIQPRRDIILLRNIYRAGLASLDEITQKSLFAAWDDIEREIDCKRLPAEKIREVESWLPPINRADATFNETKKELFDYLNGIHGFELKDLSRFEHQGKKIATFEIFLENKFFVVFPELKEKKDILIEYFQIAYGIVNTGNKAADFVRNFERRIDKLGTVFSKILKLEKEGKSPEKMKMYLLCAEYDMQDIGELAQIITDRPSLWDQGRHILSSQHLLSVSLMRKIMAHYPLMLASHVIRWNLEYLAFDANNLASKRNQAPYSYRPQISAKANRRPITSVDLRNKIFEIKDHLDRLNLDLKMDVIYPSLHLPYKAYLHPFGELALMVYPSPEWRESKEQFVHAVMELELILNYELDAKVCMIGKWDNETINFPSEQNIPSNYRNMTIDKRQEAEDWIVSMNNYEIFTNFPWTKIIYKSGLEVARNDHELYKGLAFFLQILGTDRESFEVFVNSPDLERNLLGSMDKQLKEATSDYPNSTFFKWICCLFEQFSPPGVSPYRLVCLPKGNNGLNALTTMLDDKGIGLLFLPESRDLSCMVAGIEYYNRDNQRLDILNGRSILDSAKPITPSELNTLAKYAASVLKAHSTFILEKLDPQFGLDQSQFCQVQSVQVADPILVEESDFSGQIPSEIQTLIDAEAKELWNHIMNMVSVFAKNHGKGFCIKMLDWMEIDKKIEGVAREYYGKHHVRLKGAYILMDDLSQDIFNEIYVIPNRMINFPFVTNFRNFVNRLSEETNSLHVRRGLRGTRVDGDFSVEFKALVPEAETQTSLLTLMKQREKIMDEVLYEFQADNPTYSHLTEMQVRLEINPYYLKWDSLFRVIILPKTFEVLKNSLNNKLTKNARRKAYKTLKQDIESQYKIPRVQTEDTTAKTPSEEMQLTNARVYFDGRNSTNLYRKRRVEFIKKLNELSCKITFDNEWKTHYGEPYRPFYHESLLVEAREALDSLIRNRRLPNYDFGPVRSYSDYWMFVQTNPVSTFSSVLNPLVNMINFKKCLLNGDTFEDLCEDENKQLSLATNPSLTKLIQAYIIFFPFEKAFSDCSHYIKQQNETYNRLKTEKEIAEKSNKDPWVISTCDDRLKYINNRLENAKIKYQEIREQIKETEFFKLLMFSEKWKPILEEKEPLSEEDQIEKAFQEYFEENIKHFQNSYL